MGIDHPGDMKYLVSLVPVDIGIVTNVSAVHLEFFKTIEKIAKEKSIMVSTLKPGGWGILNSDNKHVQSMKNNVNGRFLTYGLNKEASVRASDIDLSYRGENIAGLSFKLTYNGAVVPVFLPNILADHLVYAALAAAAVGLTLGMNLVEVGEALRNFVPPLGRMHLLKGVNSSLLIDDSYNGSPEATVAALNVLGKITSPSGRGHKIAVLGDMLELGDYEKMGHQLVGEAVIANNIDLLVVVGERAKIIGRTVGDAGLKNINNFDDSIEAGDYLLHTVKARDMVLIKGSQGMRMERTVKILLAEPEKAGELLVRQEESWLDKV
jgi:UDP-N-acetylmuramoyl-tripeptide--D-alanyl-D-alanine ligase